MREIGERLYFQAFDRIYNLFSVALPPHPAQRFTSVHPNSVRPGALPNLRKNDSNLFSWSYPDSWEKPCSFYGLNFQVKVVHPTNSCDSEAPILVNVKRERWMFQFSSFVAILHAGLFLTQVKNTDDTKFEVNVKTKKYVFCVRAQDKYTGGPFSPWSDCK